MITTIVQFKLAKPLGRDQVREIFLASAPKYREAPGLVRKYYLLSPDVTTAGGVYLWESREDADAMYTAAWRELITKRFGSEPRVEYFETPVIVDNLEESTEEASTY